MPPPSGELVELILGCETEDKLGDAEMMDVPLLVRLPVLVAGVPEVAALPVDTTDGVVIVLGDTDVNTPANERPGATAGAPLVATMGPMLLATGIIVLAGPVLLGACTMGPTLLGRVVLPPLVG